MNSKKVEQSTKGFLSKKVINQKISSSIRKTRESPENERMQKISTNYEFNFKFDKIPKDFKKIRTTKSLDSK